MPPDQHVSAGTAHDLASGTARSRPAPPRGRRSSSQLPLLAAVAAGGVLGAEARYGAGLLLPHGAEAFPWSTLLVNALGCLLIGILMVLLTATTAPHPLVRPFLGVGVLGGFTTFSTYAVDAQRLLLAHRPGVAAGYLAATMAAALVAVWLGATAARGLLSRGRPAATSRSGRS